MYDSNVTAYDPYPFAPEQRSNDPILESIIAPTTTAMVDFVTRVVGWKTDARYNALSYEVGSQWDLDSRALREGAVPDLRQAVAADPKLRVIDRARLERPLVPFHGLGADRGPDAGDGRCDARRRTRVSRRPHVLQPPASQAALRKDVQELFRRH